MSLNPDWEALNQLNFMLAPRIGAPLNEALNALTIIDLPESTIDPQMWHDKARAAIANVLSLYQAWSALIQYKNGQKLPPHSIRPFPVQAILDWLTVQLELLPPAKAKENLSLEGNQACIQEAILLLHSVGATQGSAVHLNVELAENGVWFRVRFNRPKDMIATVDALIEQFTGHWRSQDAAFELTMARDFIALNESKIEINWNKDIQLGEFAFFIYKSGVDRQQAPGIPASPDAEHARFVANLSRLLLKPNADQSTQPSKPDEPKNEISTDTNTTPVAENVEDKTPTTTASQPFEPIAEEEDDIPTVYGVSSISELAAQEDEDAISTALGEQAIPEEVLKVETPPISAAAPSLPAEGLDENTLKAEGIEPPPSSAKESVSESHVPHLEREPSGTKGTSLLQELRSLDQQRKQTRASNVSPKEDEKNKTQSLIISVAIPEPEPPAKFKSGSGEDSTSPKEETAS